MSEENVEIVRRGLEHFQATGEPDLESMAEDIEIHDHDIPDRSEYSGYAGVRRWFQDWGSAWAEWSFEPSELIDVGDQVIVVGRMTATGRDSGLKIDRQDAILYTLRAGLISRVDYFNSREQALEAAGAST